jgi:hypothetical protein
MELTRRDAVAALAAVGATGAGGAAWTITREDDSPVSDEQERPGDERVRETLVAVAAVVYPSDVSGIPEFVETFVGPRLSGGQHATGLRETVGTLDELAEEWHGDRVAALDPGTRERLLREVGADIAESDPDGTDAERVRYYVVNELLLALYSSPTGGDLVGIENPQGHPGGTESYQRGPR